MTIPDQNLFSAIVEPASDKLSGEQFEELLQGGSFRLVRIVSNGQATPPGQWYDQELDEWIVLLSGQAELQIDGESDTRTLTPGDYLLLPAHCRHRVERTANDEQTVWLALHFLRNR
jgi:cupin 2 domain-containing protein